MSRLTNLLLVGGLIFTHGCIGDADDASEVDSEDFDLTFSAPLTATLADTIPPGAPQVTKAYATDTVIKIHFAITTGTVTGYDVFRRTGMDPAGVFSQIASGAALAYGTWGNYRDAALPFNTTYCYKVRFFNTLGEATSAPLCIATEVPFGVPESPLNLTATSTTNSITLKWIDNSNNENFFGISKMVKRTGQVDGSREFVSNPQYVYLKTLDTPDRIGTGRTITFTDVAVNPSSGICYVVWAQNAFGGSIAQERCISTQHVPIPAPSNLVIAETESGAMVLTWTNHYAYANGVFDVLQREGSGSYVEKNFHPTEPRARLSLKSDTAYCFRVRSTNPVISSPPSNEACGRTLQAAPPPTQGDIVTTLGLTKRPPLVGFVPYVGGLLVQGSMKKIEVAPFNDVTAVAFVKKGFSSADCGNSNATVLVLAGNSVNVSAIAGTETIPANSTLVACVATNNSATSPNTVFLNVTYTPAP